MAGTSMRAHASRSDIDALNALDNVEAVRLDVTIPGEIDAAVARVKSAGRGLYGLVNNAGVFIGGPLADVPVDEIAWLMDVNVFGVVRVTQAFAPMIVESQGRITSIGSISGILSGGYMGPYSMSKHAIEAFTDSLAAEMAPLGVEVSVIEPGNYNSAIADSALARMRTKRDEYLQEGSPFAADFGNWLEQDFSRDHFKDPVEVAIAVERALTDAEPLRRYMTVPNEREAAITIDKALSEVVQLNDGHAYRFSRSNLIGRLDDASGFDPDADRAALRTLLDDFLANAADRDTHAGFWADDLVYTSSRGTRTDRDSILASFDASEADSDVPGPVYSADRVSIRLYGSTAVVAFRLIATPPPESAEPVSHYLNTGTFVKSGDEWRAVAWQATTVPTAGED